MSEIDLRRVSKHYSGAVPAVDTVDLHVDDGEFMVLVGPSGCGKSTILRMIAGLDSITRGQLLIGGKDVTAVQPQERDIAMVFQNYALYPHMTVRENLGYALKVRKVPKAARVERVNGVARILGLSELLERKPAQLSGGQRQRVAMGRAIVREPRAFLMDEPLSNLDAKLRVSMRAELTRLHHRLGVTTIYVTHDQVEAMTLGERVAVLKDGRVQQVGTPHELFHYPANLFVATFIGSPSMNLIGATVHDGRVAFADFDLPLPSGTRTAGRDGRVILGVRPTDFAAVTDVHPEWPCITVTPEVVEDLGAECHIIFPVNAPTIEAAVTTDEAAEDSPMNDRGRAMFTAQVSTSCSFNVGQPVELAVDCSRLHFFDPDTTLAVAVCQSPASL